MLQYKIPQNVGIEDKIVGPFSLRQLIILAAGGGISYLIFVISARLYELNILEYIIICIPAMIALAAAMLKIRNVTFTKFILLTLEFAIKPKKRMWDHHSVSAVTDPDLTPKKKVTKNPAKKENVKQRKDVNLRELSATLDSRGFGHLEEIKHEDIDKVDDDDLITQAYFGNKKEQGTGHNMYWRTREVQKKKLDILAKMPAPKIEKKQVSKAETTPSQSDVLNSNEEKIKVNKKSESQIGNNKSILPTPTEEDRVEKTPSKSKVAIKNEPSAKNPIPPPIDNVKAQSSDTVKVTVNSLKNKPKSENKTSQRELTEENSTPEKQELASDKVVQKPKRRRRRRKKKKDSTTLTDLNQGKAPESKGQNEKPSDKEQLDKKNVRESTEVPISTPKEQSSSQAGSGRGKVLAPPVEPNSPSEHLVEAPQSTSSSSGSEDESTTTADEFEAGDEIEFNFD